MSAAEANDLPTALWPYGYGGAGANSPEYDRKLDLLIRFRNEYLEAFPGERRFIDAGVDPVPIRWINKRLEEEGEDWRVVLADGGYQLIEQK